MKKLSLALTLLSTLALTGTAFADHDRDRDDRGRAPIVDGLAAAGGLVVVEHHGDERGPMQPPGGPGFRGDERGPMQPPMGAPGFGGGPGFPGGPMAQHGVGARARWSLLAAEPTPYQRGSITLAVPKRGDLDQLRVVASERGLDIVAVELTYKKGRSELVRPARDGAVTIDLAAGKLKKIEVRYINRGAGPGAAIQVLGKDEARGGLRR